MWQLTNQLPGKSYDYLVVLDGRDTKQAWHSMPYDTPSVPSDRIPRSSSRFASVQQTGSRTRRISALRRNTCA